MKLSEIAWIWPQMLWLLCLLPLLAILYIQRRRQQASTSTPATWLTQLATPQRAGYGSAILILLGIVAMTLAAARPQAVILVPQRVDAVMLVLDTSGSMRADDVSPSRIEAAKAAIRGFIEQQPVSMKVGLVSVAATAVVTQMPTTDREALYSALDGIALQRGSALGAGIAVALAAVLPPGSIPLQAILNGEYKEPISPETAAATRDSVAIVMLSDGAGNMEPDARTMAKLAARQGVRIYTVGIGTPQGAILRAQGMAMRVRLEEDLLKLIATETSADYFGAASLTELHRVYETMGKTIVFRQQRQTEITGALLLIAALLLGLGSAIGLMRSGRVI